MSVSRLKTIFIVALVLVNAFFLTIIIVDTYADARSERQAIENVCAILQSNGIDIDPDNVKPTDTLRTMRTARGVEPEAIIANAFLGQVDMTDQGMIYLYDSPDRGTAEFSSGGDFVIQLHEGIIMSDNGTMKVVTDLVRDMKIETLALTVTVKEDSEIVRVVNTYRGSSIFNCTIDFVFSRGSLRTVSGRYVTRIEPAEDGGEISNAGTALLGFLAAMKRGDLECADIQSVEAGYWHSVVGSFGEGVIAPVWLITTDSGRYIIDSATGEIRSI